MENWKAKGARSAVLGNKEKKRKVKCVKRQRANREMGGGLTTKIEG